MRSHLLIPFALLAACSSGSGSGDAATSTIKVTPADTAITVDNAVDAVQAGVRGAFDPLRLFHSIASLLQKPIPQEDPEGGGTSPSVLSFEHEGPEGGTATLTWDDVDDGGTYSSADTFTIAFDDYAEAGLTLAGVVVIEGQIQGLLPGQGTWIVDATMRMLGLDVTVGVQTTTFSREFPFHFENRLILEVLELTLDDDLEFGAFTIQKGAFFGRYGGSDSVRYAMTGSVWSAALDGVVEFEVPYMTGDYLSPNPFLGSFFVRGTEGSVIEAEPFCLIPLSLYCTSLDLYVDEDGDETLEDTQNVSWLALMPQ